VGHFCPPGSGSGSSYLIEFGPSPDPEPKHREQDVQCFYGSLYFMKVEFWPVLLCVKIAKTSQRFRIRLDPDSQLCSNVHFWARYKAFQASIFQTYSRREHRLGMFF
jgi:hypothetical protein